MNSFPAIFLCCGLLSLAVVASEASSPPFMGSSQAPGAVKPEALGSAREMDFNFGWKFIEKDEREAFVPDFDDTGWRNVRLPHDWSVEHSFDKSLEGATGYLPGGIGWYRKSFTADLSPEQACYLCFDGIYNNSEIWLNGRRLGFHPYGYSPIVDEISKLLVKGENVLAVRVDRSRIVDSRWYPGAGIYRNVRMIVTDKLHMPVWGAYVTTPEVTKDRAKVAIENTVANLHLGERTFTLVNRILDPSGNEVAKGTANGSAAAGGEVVLKSELEVADPVLWGVAHGNLYQLVTSILVEGGEVDSHVTRFGIRTLRFDPDEGFFLNGESMKIKGVCLHHDGGLVGAAVPVGVWKRRLETLRDAGANAIRISHQPGAGDFMALCDEMGFLVQVEFFDEWDSPKDKRTNTWEKKMDYASRGYCEYFQTHAEQDLKITARRDRNHPSVFMWSIGNEIEWTYPRNKVATGYFGANSDGNYFWTQPPFSAEEIRKRYAESEDGGYAIERTAAKLSKWAKEMDATRPVVANMILPSVSLVSGYADVLDIVGFSYRRVMYDRSHKDRPDKMILGTENVAQYHEWKAIMERPFVAGTFLWTGIDYMGEVNEKWPVKALACGLLDTAGFPKPSYQMMKSLWHDEPHVYVCSQTAEKSPYRAEGGRVVEKKPGDWQHRLWIWHDVNEHWNYQAGEPVIAEVYTNCPEVELFLNGRSLGVKRLADNEDHELKWALPFEGGELKAVGSKDGRKVEFSVKTHGKPVAVRLETDHATLAADGHQVAHVVAQLVDADGNPVRTEDRPITFDVTGPCSVLGVDNGAPDNVQDYQSTSLTTSRGRALMIVRGLRTGGEIAIGCKGEGLGTGGVSITSE